MEQSQQSQRGRFRGQYNGRLYNNQFNQRREFNQRQNGGGVANSGQGADINNNSMNCRPTISQWRALAKRQSDLMQETVYLRQIIQNLSLQKIEMEQHFMIEKEMAVEKAKMDTFNQLIYLGANSHNMYQDPFVSSDPKLNLESREPLTHHHPLLSTPAFYSGISEAQSPCFQPMYTFDTQGTMSDLRDRFEDIRCSGLLDQSRNPNYEEQLHMIQKIVAHYDSLGMRVYEECIPRQFVSTLVCCPNEQLCPKRNEPAFAIGFGSTQNQATESVLYHAYNSVLHLQDDNDENVDNQ